MKIYEQITIKILNILCQTWNILEDKNNNKQLLIIYINTQHSRHLLFIKNIHRSNNPNMYMKKLSSKMDSKL